MIIHSFSFEEFSPQTANLAPGEIHTWIVSIHDASLSREDFHNLSEEEHLRASRLSQPEARLRFLSSHAALRRLLSFYLDCPAQELVFAAGKYGKPYLSYSGGLNRPDIQFSLSHSGEFAALAFSCSAPVGIDIEKLRPFDKAFSLADRFFHPEETARLSELEPEEQHRLFFRLWTLREAFLKGIGTGFYTAPDSFCIAASGPNGPYQITQPLEGQEAWELSPIPAPEGYLCSVSFQES